MARETRVGRLSFWESLSQCLSLFPVSGSHAWVPYPSKRQPICMVPTSQVPFLGPSISHCSSSHSNRRH